MAVEVAMPRLSDSMEEATILSWLVSEGEAVSEGTPLVEVETDKATVTYEAEAGGVLARIVVGEGETAALGATIALIAAAGEQVADAAPDRGGSAAATAAAPAGGAPAAAAGEASAAAAAATAAAAAPAGGGARPKASPLARRIGAELGVDLSAIAGSGPGGRIVKADVEAAAAAPAEAAPAQAAPAAAAPAAQADAPRDGAKGAVTRAEPSRLQQTVARRMAESRATVPEFELTIDVDMTACVELRARLKEIADPAPSYNDMVVKACARALREHPRVNGSYRDGAFEAYGRVNVGVAVAADDALVVPTVLDADQRSLGDVARETRRLAAAVRDGSIAPPDLAGGTFTVSNLGMFGVRSFSAVVNAPQAAILAVGALERRPAVADDGETIVAREQMTITLAADHRILYGADAARFLARVRELLEQPLGLAL